VILEYSESFPIVSSDKAGFDATINVTNNILKNSFIKLYSFKVCCDDESCVEYYFKMIVVVDPSQSDSYSQKLSCPFL